MLYSKSSKIDSKTIYISNSLISNTSELKDLGIIFQSNLKFDKHIESILFTAKKKLNFLKFTCKHFKNINLLISMYNCIVKSILMYRSVLWNPNKKGVIEALEKIQHFFLRFLSYKTKIPMNYSDHDDPIMKLTNIKSLENSRAINDLKFLFKLNNHHIISPDQGWAIVVD